MSLMALSSSGPSAVTVSVVPAGTAIVMRPRIDLASTLWLLCVSVMEDLKKRSESLII